MRRVLALTVILAGCDPTSDPGTQSIDRFPDEIRTAVAPKQATTLTVARLDFTSVDRAPDFDSRVFPLPRGGWGVSSGVFEGIVQTFDSAGSPARQFGRLGEGPGEFMGSVYGAVSDSLLWLVDPAAARISRFNGDLELVDTRPFDSYGRVFSVVSAPGGPGIVMGAFFGTGGVAARLDADARLDLVGGEIPATEDGATPGEQIQYAVPVSSTEVWTVSKGDGTVRVHDAGLDVVARHSTSLASLLDAIEWEVPLHDGQMPPPEVMGIGVGDGLVWIMVAVPDRNWVPGPSRT